MAKVKIGSNASTYSSTISELNQIAATLQPAIDQYNSLNLPALVSTELQALFAAPADLIFDKLSNGKDLTLAGVPVIKSKAIDIIQKPAGYEDLLTTITEVKNILRSDHSFSLGKMERTFEISNEGIVSIRASKTAEIEESCNLYATSDKAIKMHQLAQFFIAKADELGVSNMFVRNPNGAGSTLKTIISGGDGKPLGINVDGLIKYNADRYPDSGF